jgi:hypothetical protein
VLYAYAGKNHSLIENFKKTTKNSFREGIRNYISSKFFFYRLNVKEELKDFVDKNFRMLNGKIFSFPLNDSTCLIMALQKCGIPVIDNFMVSDLKGQIPKNPTNDDIANENLNIVRMFHDIMYPYKLDGQGELKKENALSIPISNNVEMAAEPNPDGYKDKQNS